MNTRFPIYSLPHARESILKRVLFDELPTSVFESPEPVDLTNLSAK